MRIVGGRFRGRTLKSPASNATRPTTDRLREALFNVLAHAYGDPADGARVLDLFAGTGALGWRRGRGAPASPCSSREAAEACGLIRAGVRRFGVAGVTRLNRRDATRLSPGRGQWCVRSRLLRPALWQGSLHRANSSAPAMAAGATGALVLVEEAVEAAFKAPDGFEETERRRYDTTEVTFLRLILTNVIIPEWPPGHIQDPENALHLHAIPPLRFAAAGMTSRGAKNKCPPALPPPRSAVPGPPGATGRWSPSLISGRTTSSSARR